MVEGQGNNADAHAAPSLQRWRRSPFPVGEGQGPSPTGLSQVNGADALAVPWLQRWRRLRLAPTWGLGPVGAEAKANRSRSGSALPFDGADARAAPSLQRWRRSPFPVGEGPCPSPYAVQVH